jgi:hypothetical protein
VKFEAAEGVTGSGHQRENCIVREIEEFRVSDEFRVAAKYLSGRGDTGQWLLVKGGDQFCLEEGFRSK